MKNCLVRQILDQKKMSNEPPHDKTNKMTVHPASDQSSLFTWRNIASLSTHWAHNKDWSDWVHAQAHLSLCWVHMPFYWFCHAQAQMADLRLCCSYMGQVMQKCVLCHMPTTKVQISLCIHGLISIFIVRCLDSMICILDLSKISRF